jgi:hypothetical protein
MSKPELLEKLRELDPVYLIELLNISSDEIVDEFLDKVDERFQYIHRQLEERD